MQNQYQIIHSECLAALKQMQDNSVDSIVTDPPYSLRFMQKKWDYALPSQKVWEECLRVLKPGGFMLAFGAPRQYHRLVCGIEDSGFEIRDSLSWVYASGMPKGQNLKGEFEGWSTTLKPAWEGIVLVRKPLEGTVLENMQTYRTGALNIKACAVPAEGASRFPSNLIHDGSEEVLSCFPDAKGQQGAISGKEPSSKTKNAYGEYQGRSQSKPREESDKSAARFFYCAKASKKDRGEGNKHPTVKPTDLMRYLCRLVTPPGGIVLDPFMGSGSTGKAAMLEGFKFIGIDMQEEYCNIAEERIKAVLKGIKE